MYINNGFSYFLQKKSHFEYKYLLTKSGFVLKLKRILELEKKYGLNRRTVLRQERGKVLKGNSSFFPCEVLQLKR